MDNIGFLIDYVVPSKQVLDPAEYLRIEECISVDPRLAEWSFWFRLNRINGFKDYVDPSSDLKMFFKKFQQHYSQYLLYQIKPANNSFTELVLSMWDIIELRIVGARDNIGELAFSGYTELLEQIASFMRVEEHIPEVMEEDIEDDSSLDENPVMDDNELLEEEELVEEDREVNDTFDSDTFTESEELIEEDSAEVIDNSTPIEEVESDQLDQELEEEEEVMEDALRDTGLPEETQVQEVIDQEEGEFSEPAAVVDTQPALADKMDVETDVSQFESYLKEQLARDPNKGDGQTEPAVRGQLERIKPLSEVAVSAEETPNSALSYPDVTDDISMKIMRTLGTNQIEMAQFFYMVTGRRSMTGYSEMDSAGFDETIDVISMANSDVIKDAMVSTLRRFWRMGETHLVSQLLTEMSYYLEEVHNAKNRD